MRFSSLILSLCLLLFASPAFGQSIVLRPDDVLPKLKSASKAAFYINGPAVHGLTDEMTKADYRLGDTAKYAMALITLRLIDQGLIKLDEPVAKAVPDLLEFDPFEVAITPRHLMTETAGFAHAPTGLNEQARIAPLKYFLIKNRGAGQLDDSDPIGWHLLVSLLERRTGQSLATLVAQHLLAPLGIREADFHMAEPATAWQLPLSSARIRGAALAAFLGPLQHNITPIGQPFLKAETYDLLIGTPLWQMHPLSPGRMAGLMLEPRSNYTVLIPPSNGYGQEFSFAALPGSGLVFVETGKGSGHFTFLNTVGDILHRNVPPTYDRQADLDAAFKLVPPTEYGRFYVCADTRSDLAGRVRNVAACQMQFRPNSDGTFTVITHDHDSTHSLPMTRVAPYYFQPPAEGSSLIFSPYKAGGYAMINQKKFVKAGMLGRLRGKTGAYIPLIAIMLLTGAIHIWSKTSVQWRRFGWFCLIGTTLVSVGLYADWHYWATVLYEMQMPWLITLWRTGLNIGLMLVLALPMLAMAFVRQQNMPKRGLALLFAGPHLGLITLAALALFLATVFWGMAGTFTAY